MQNAHVFNIQRFSIHDGPGIRTTVFLKGCNLRCFWCHNPESVKSEPQIQFFPDKCIGCRACEICPDHAHSFTDGIHTFSRTDCKGCGKCAEACYAEALILTGRSMTSDEVFGQIERDKPFYSDEGGVTFSGGEPLLQYEFVAECAKICHTSGITVAVDTAGCVDYSAFEAVLPYTNLFLFDIKHYDDGLHRRYTGVSNRRIITNLIGLLSTGARVWIRIPLIPTVNDSDADITRIAELIRGVEDAAGHWVERVELMPFHGTAEGKYASLGMIYAASGLKTPDKSVIARYYEIINKTRKR